MSGNEIDEIKKSIIETFNFKKHKILFKAGNYIEIIKISKKLVDKFKKKINAEEKKELLKFTSLHILDEAIYHKIIEEDKAVFIKNIIELSDISDDISEFLKKRCC